MTCIEGVGKGGGGRRRDGGPEHTLDLIMDGGHLIKTLPLIDNYGFCRGGIQ